eukprot:TRINITY_DN9506_c0_g1_i1.p2 TRINITY_DN9506_c0_g1~~TRINITY_DN9506_c0_g1_i1.p2  ORF type:complete len:135 (-),score=31.99 TRINITY_DN9506_c0_g1_i1:132-488(-)
MVSEVRASHLLIKHSGSRRPASWKDPNGNEIRNRSKEKAISILTALRNQILNGADFAQLASQHSDCGSARDGGDLGFFGRGAMMASFEEAAFGLPVGQISDIVETDSGVHIIVVTDRR